MFWRFLFLTSLLLPVFGVATQSTAQPREIVLAQAAPRAQVQRAKMGVQIALKVLGFDPGSVDGKIGRKTRNAMRAYQRSIGARATGVLSEAQILRILAEAKARVVQREAAQKAATSQQAQTPPRQTQAASELLAGVPSNIVVFSAAKGREFSFEAPGGEGGVFSRAFAAVIDGERRTHDLDNNGAIEISELFVGIKRKVVIGGRLIREGYARQNKLDVNDVTQTPWLARNQMVGDFALF